MQRAPAPSRPRTPLPRAITRARVGAAGLVALVTASCGASINAVYEGDVRFEHCMALDMEKHVKPTIRKACWEEWTKFYTFGQTRDRVEYARLRMKQLSGASDFEESDLATEEPRVASAVPEPTSALAPPPMMLAVDAGSSGPSADASPDVAAESPESTCGTTCEATWNECKAACTTATCERGCAAQYKRCTRKCS
ncbi:hypothetical protein [Polyangium spumosum]|uniref:hypothetical protein n=1 Tax=Polyangium spumosum TaxID=889282 RepID=UPI001F0FD3E1|nr:hypothetical protein [Polyangium spumosum]